MLIFSLMLMFFASLIIAVLRFRRFARCVILLFADADDAGCRVSPRCHAATIFAALPFSPYCRALLLF